jgi:nucleotide-binding universal stress UspA family protein
MRRWTMYKLLFPVDLSGLSSKIAPKMLAMAEKLEAEVHLLSVGESTKQFGTFYVPHPSLGVLEKDMTRGMDLKLQEFQFEYFPDYPKVQRVIKVGDPAEEIMKYIRSAGIDVVIMATHGRKGLSRVLFGSVTEKVVKGSPVPVMVTRPGEDEPELEVQSSQAGRGTGV